MLLWCEYEDMKRKTIPAHVRLWGKKTATVLYGGHKQNTEGSSMFLTDLSIKLLGFMTLNSNNVFFKLFHTVWFVLYLRSTATWTHFLWESEMAQSAYDSFRLWCRWSVVSPPFRLFHLPARCHVCSSPSDYRVTAADRWAGHSASPANDRWALTGRNHESLYSLVSVTWTSPAFLTCSHHRSYDCYILAVCTWIPYCS